MLSQRFVFTSWKLVFFVTGFCSIYAGGIRADEWSPPNWFPNVAVAKMTGEGNLQLLVPLREVECTEHSQAYTFAVPCTEMVDGVAKQSTRNETLKRQVKVRTCKDSFKTVRTQISCGAVELTNVRGDLIPPDQLMNLLFKPCYIVLGGSGPLPSFISNMLRKDVLVLSQDKLDPEYATLPATEGLLKKWDANRIDAAPRRSPTQFRGGHS